MHGSVPRSTHQVIGWYVYEVILIDDIAFAQMQAQAENRHVIIKYGIYRIWVNN